MTVHDFMTFVNSKSLAEVLQEYPIAEDFLANLRLDNLSQKLPLPLALEEVDDEIFGEFGTDRFRVLLNFCEFLETFTQTETSSGTVSTLTIMGGFNK